MMRETRIVIAPNKSLFKWRKWFWTVQRRNYAWSKAWARNMCGTWYEVARGYARHQPAAEQAACLWLEEEALKIRTAQAKVEEQAARAQKQAELTTIINVEEN